MVSMVAITSAQTSVNLARRTWVPVFAGGWALSQLWLFPVAPIVGGLLGAAAYILIGGKKAPLEISE